MSAIMDDTDKVQQFHEDAVANKLAVLPPDIHASEYRFVPVDEKSIRYGLGGHQGHRGIGGSSTSSRRALPVPSKIFSISACAWTGASSTAASSSRWCGPGRFDSINPHRASFAGLVGIAMEAGEQASRSASQVSLFGESSGDGRRAETDRGAALGTIPSACRTRNWRWVLLQRPSVQILRGRVFLGCAHAPVETACRPRRKKARASCISPAWSNRSGCRRPPAGRMMVMMLSDGTARVEVVVYDEVLDRHRNLVRTTALVLVEAKVRSLPPRRRRGRGRGHAHRRRENP